ncbi:MAG: CDP-alcohol phosphatidyltransferase family protein [candidate division WOR-3 bacterium]
MPSSRRLKGIYKHLPNIVSLSRVFFGYFLILALLKNDKITFWIFLILTAVSDGLDGFLARGLNAVSNLGKVLDHTVDKVLILTIAYILTLKYGLPLWVLYILILRELITSLVALWVKILKGKFPSSNPVCRVFGLLSALTLIAFFYDYGFKIYVLYSALIFMVISSVANLVSLRRWL